MLTFTRQTLVFSKYGKETFASQLSSYENPSANEHYPEAMSQAKHAFLACKEGSLIPNSTEPKDLRLMIVHSGPLPFALSANVWHIHD